MSWNCMFFINSILLGIGLAMDAFSVSIVNAISEPNMSRTRQCGISCVYAFFQFLMPLTGWLCVHTIASVFTQVQKFIPWIALILLLYIGIKMIVEALASRKTACSTCQKKGDECKKCSVTLESHALSLKVLLMQGIATSIDALSTGFTIAEYGLLMASVASLIIAAVTFAICLTGLKIGRFAGKKLSSSAEIFGGIILICIGIEIFVRGIFGLA